MANGCGRRGSTGWLGAPRAARLAGLAGLAAAAAACAGGPPPAAGPEGPAGAKGPAEAAAEAAAGGAYERRPDPAPGRLAVGRLPEIPAVTGPVTLRVQYPARHQRLAVRDSNFIFGTTGTGDARLEVDGVPVPVEPNGAFLAFLPVPPPERGDTAVYRLVAAREGRADTLLHPVRVPSPPAPPAAGAWADTAAFRPAEPRWAAPEAPVPFRARARPGQAVWLEAGEARFHLAPAAPDRLALSGEGAGAAPDELASGAVEYAAAVPAGRLHEAACGDGAPVGACARGAGPWAEDTVRLRLVAAVDGDTLRVARRLALRLLDPEALPVARLEEAPDTVNGRAGVVVGRPTPFGTYRWRFPPGTEAPVEERVGERLRLRLLPDLAAWVEAEDAVLLPAAPPGAEGPPVVRDVRVSPEADRLAVRLGVSRPVPAEVEVTGPRTVRLTLYGALGETDRVAHGPAEPLLDSVRWEQLPGPAYRLTLRLARPVWGHRIAWERADGEAYEGPRGEAAGPRDGGAPVLRLELRRPPDVDPRRPLEGVRVAVDPGHPGAGAHGPTGLYEGDANLAVARHLEAMLREEGAVPILVRRDTLPVGLYERTERARRAGAHLFVSIHNNALPDGIRPVGREGTSTYYYHPHSRDLAAAVQAGMLEEMRLRDLGVLWGNLAVARASWMPSVLTEGVFMMIPRHEAALREPAFQALYARGVLRGIAAFLRERAAR